MSSKISRVVVLDCTNGEVDIIAVEEAELNRYADVEDYLVEHCNYNLNSISWMLNPNSINFLDNEDFKQ